MNLQTDTTKKRIITIGIMLFLGAIAILIYTALTGNTNQKFTDIVIEFTASDGSNKSAERSLFYIFSLIGILIYGFIFLKSKWGANPDIKKELTGIDVIFTGLCVSFITNLVIYKTINALTVAALILTAVAFKKEKARAVNLLAFFFVCVYAICGIYRAAVFVGVRADISLTAVAIIAFAISLIILFIGQSEGTSLRGILIAQLLVPFTLLVYLASDYIYNGEFMNIHISARVTLVIIAIITAFFVEAIVKIKGSWSNPNTLSDVLSFGACVCIMAFNRFSGTGSIMAKDLHHPFENLIGYSQMFELGQKAFEEYIPVSGMYSVLHGLFFKVFGLGFGGFYYLSANMFYLAVVFAVVFLLRRQLQAQWVLLISLLFVVTDYNRVALIVPIILLLTWPKLIEKKNLWLKAWFLTSFIHGIYYPVFGAAVCIGFLPLGIWQIYTYAKSGELVRDIKTVKFWAWWVVCFVPLLCGLGWLIGTAKHMLAMGSQTIFADGVARFGQEIGEDFLPYLSNVPVKLIVYYLFSYLIMVGIIWISFALFLRSGNAVVERWKLKLTNHELAFIALSIALMLLISFSYTVVRFDYYDIYSRSDGVIRAAFVVLILLIARYFCKSKNALWIFAFAMFITSAVSGEGFLGIDADSKLESSYTVPEGYVYVANNEPRLGECFLAQDSYEYISHINDYLNTLDKEQSYLGIVDSFGLYYLCDVKGDSAMEILNTIRGYGAVEETVEVIRANDTIVGMNISPLRNYYFYHWLVTSGDYVFDNDARLFFPNDGSVSKEEILQQNKDINLNLSTEADVIGDVAGSFGSSLDTLMPVFTEKDYEYEMEENGDSLELDFAEEFDGDEADFIYLQFDGMTDNYNYGLFSYHSPVLYNQYDASAVRYLMKKFYNDGMTVTVAWTSEAGEEISMTCNMDEGKLLLPLGAARGWLLNNHDNVTITVQQNDEVIEMPEIKTIKFLKLREVQ